MTSEKDANKRPSEFVEALAKGLAVLAAFDAEHSDMNLSEIARRVDISPAAARRSLITLIELGYVGQDKKRFFLRPQVLRLGSAFYTSARVDTLLLPEVQQIVAKFGDASSVATLEGHEVVYLAHYSVQRARRAMAVVGARYPAHATSAGRVLLANLSREALDDYLETATLAPLTSATITDKASLRAEIFQVRAQDYSTTVDQLDYGISAIAVPVRNAAGDTIAAINSSGYSGMITRDALVTDRLQDLREAAVRIAQQFTNYPMLDLILR